MDPLTWCLPTLASGPAVRQSSQSTAAITPVSLERLSSIVYCSAAAGG